MTGQVTVAIVERDLHGDVLCAWSYPSLDNVTEAVIIEVRL